MFSLMFVNGTKNRNIFSLMFVNGTKNSNIFSLMFVKCFRHMVKNHSDCERGNPLPPHGLLLLINSKGSFICIIPQTG